MVYLEGFEDPQSPTEATEPCNRHFLPPETHYPEMFESHEKVVVFSACITLLDLIGTPYCLPEIKMMKYKADPSRYYDAMHDVLYGFTETDIPVPS